MSRVLGLKLDAALAETPNATPTLIASFGGVVTPQSLWFPFNRLPASDALGRDARTEAVRRG